MSKLRICLISAEVTPFSKTGGLADVLSGLGRFLGRQGHDVRIVTPLYDKVARGPFVLEPQDAIGKVPVPFDGWAQEFRVRSGNLPDSEVPVYFVDCPGLYGRSQMYSNTYGDEHLRFALLGRAALEICQRLDWVPDVFHCNDWHAALLPLYKQTLYGWDKKLWPAKTVLTIHNIGYQGQFSTRVVPELGLRGQEARFHQDDFARGEINFMKTGLLYADSITTVSRTYAEEICTADGGRGLEGILQERRGALVGIVNGCDYGEWDPAADAMIPSNYSVDDLAGKAECRRRMLERMGLNADSSGPVLGMVSRLTSQKGLDLLPDVLPVFLRQYPDARLCVLGSGEQRYEDYFQWLRDTFPKQVGIYRGYHEELAHWIEAGSDLFLMPSAFEPCGLNQMYSLKYGTVPIVRRTGGLADTVEPWNPGARTGNGFVFGPYESMALLQELRNAVACHSHPESWAAIQANGMRADWSWAKQGPEYVALYRRLVQA